MNRNEPLGLPRGSVRAILALLLVGSTIVFNGAAIVTGGAPDPTTIGLTGMVVGYYFARRDVDGQTAGGDDEALGDPAIGDGE